MPKGINLQRFFFYNEQCLKMLYMVRGASLMKSYDNDDDDDNGNTKKRTQAVCIRH